MAGCGISVEKIGRRSIHKVLKRTSRTSVGEIRVLPSQIKGEGGLLSDEEPSSRRCRENVIDRASRGQTDGLANVAVG
eukprot:7391969-Prymnesium_polylepis.1